jgi:hypothetical protein
MSLPTSTNIRRVAGFQMFKNKIEFLPSEKSQSGAQLQPRLSTTAVRLHIHAQGLQQGGCCSSPPFAPLRCACAQPIAAAALLAAKTLRTEHAVSSTRKRFFSLYIPHTTRSFCLPEKASRHFTSVL